MGFTAAAATDVGLADAGAAAATDIGGGLLGAGAFGADTLGAGAFGGGAMDLGALGGAADFGATGSAGGLFGGAGGFFGGGLGGLTSGLQLAGSVYGLYSGNQMRQQEQQAQNQRNQFIGQLSNLTANPNSVTSMPGYKFGIDQGTQTLNRQLAAQGLTGSGAQMQELQQFGQQYAGQFLNQEQTRLANLAGMNMAPYQNNSNAMIGNSLDNLVMWSVMQGRDKQT